VLQLVSKDLSSQHLPAESIIIIVIIFIIAIMINNSCGSLLLFVEDGHEGVEGEELVGIEW